ncbi:unnamed protein product [Trichobilharzia szidati]|nr:unnamed protein product [Trichobilharzia szidati]
MYRRQQFDRLNPRNVLPSRHTLFIRGLPGSTDVTKVKDFFSNETNSRCSVEFFSTSEDKKRFSVAIRFKSHDIASEMLRRHNGKTMFGYPVELTWFKDLKKARAKMYEEQRQGRRFPPSARGFRGPERRSMQSPGNYGDSRRIRTGSSSSGGRGYRDGGRDRRSVDRRSLDRRSMDRRSTDGRSADHRSEERSTGRRSTDRRTASRSRSFTGSSSRSASRSVVSRSRSVSNARHSLPSNHDDSMNASESEFNGRNYDDRRVSRNRSRHSHDRSSSSSRSSGERRRQSSSNRHSVDRNHTPYDNSGGENSSPDYQKRKKQRLSRSPSMNEENLAYSNAPAPNPEGGSSLGFEQSPVRGDSFSRRSRHSSENSSSGASVASSNGAFDSPKNRSGRKRMHSISPPYNNHSSRSSKAKTAAASNGDEKSRSIVEPQKRRKTRNTRSPVNSTESHDRHNTRSKAQRTSLRKTPEVENSVKMRQTNASRKRRSSVSKSSQRSSGKDSSPVAGKKNSKGGHNSRRSENTRSPLSTTVSNTAKRWRTPEDEVSDDPPRKVEKWPTNSGRLSKSKNKSSTRSVNNSSDNDHSDASKVSGSQSVVPRGNKSLPKTSEPASSKNNSGSKTVTSSAPTINNKESAEPNDSSEDVMNLIRDRKDTLAEEYKRDCEAFTTVVRMLIR